jgi:uncharacterized membrane protein YecN with MAPEG domain
MADGMLLTRQERRRLFFAKLGAAYAPPALVGVIALALGGGSVGWMILIVGALLAVFVATSARRVRGALIGGIVGAVALFLFQLLVALVVSHPIE